tara:strand:+ start:81 stop:227 length:147 start_codon:yes stop_codon:yes gene_type:complete
VAVVEAVAQVVAVLASLPTLTTTLVVVEVEEEHLMVLVAQEDQAVKAV